MSTDSIAEMFTVIRNANRVFKEKVDVPASKMKLNIARLLKEKGFISNYKFIEDRKQGILRIYLRYTPERKHILLGLKRVSKPGRRIYRSWQELPRVYKGLGYAIVSTAQGLITDEEARSKKLGGEVVGLMW
ncbi:MAG TPA: 30S ribosomal protein S8 [Elusimicrobia bacterium]|jgi:small subunit ribosomal protein S8|nr:30S ribosomal protein S8 [Elusimicrobiota bacterium]